jgi:hypothetical protein
VINDSGLGVNAWNTTDNSMSAGGNYARFLNSSEFNSLAGKAWTLRANLRVASGIENVAGNTHNANIMYFQSPAGIFAAEFGKQADGDPVVILWNGGPIETAPKIVIEGGGDTYHLYELVFIPISSSALLYVDGTQLFSGYTGNGEQTPAIVPAVVWGAASTVGLGSANWKLVEFDVPGVVPDGMNTGGLMILAFCGLILAKRLQSLTI